MATELQAIASGCTTLDNTLLDRILTSGLNERQLLVLLAIVRRSASWRDESDVLPASVIGAMIGKARNHVNAALRQLEALQIIRRTASPTGARISLNPNLSQWMRPRLTLVATPEPEPEPVAEPLPETIPAPEPAPEPGKAAKAAKAPKVPKPQKAAKAPKAVPDDSGFEAFWAAYPRRIGKQAALKAWAKRAPGPELQQQIMDGLARAKASRDWLKDGGEYIPHPSTWLNGGRWTDELVSEGYTEPQRELIAAYNAALGNTVGRVDPEVFVPKLAGDIDWFMTVGANTERGAAWKRYFPHVRDHVDVPPRCGLAWLISRDGFSKVKEGVFDRER